MLMMMIMISIALLEDVPNGSDATDEQCWEPVLAISYIICELWPPTDDVM